jgi:phospholipid transport system substrate-binding protein
MKPYFWMSLALLLVIANVAQAQPPMRPGFGPYAAAPRANPGTEAAAALREGMDKLLDFLAQDEKPNKLQVAAFLDSTIAPYFDFDYMAKWVAGPGYSSMSSEQKEALAASLEARFLGTLTGQLVKYKDQKVRFFRPRRGPRGAVSVGVGILRPGGYPSKLDFRMYRSEDGWKVYDVMANGRSAVAFYRQQAKRASAPRQPAPGPYGR